MERIEVNVITGERIVIQLTEADIADIEAANKTRSLPLTWDDIRAKRDQLILASDWTMTPGATVDQAQWAAYRQILRDLPQTFASTGPESVVWPQQPTAVGPNTKEVKEAAVKIDEEQA